MPATKQGGSQGAPASASFRLVTGEKHAMPASLARVSRLPADVLVIDPVVHALNLSAENIVSKYGEQLYQMSYGLHCMVSPPHAIVPQPRYMTDMSAECLARTIFEETQTAIAATHTLTLYSWFKDGFCREEKTVEMCAAHPNRMLGYVGVDPTRDLAFVLEDLERQVAACPNAVGVKMYPHQMNPYRHWRTNDETVLRMIERAQSLGLKTVGIHKALPNGSVPLAPYRIEEDFEQAADAFPNMAFEIIHGGMAFVEETAMAIGRFPNVYVNLETTTAMLYQAPGRFEAALALLLQWGGPEKIIWSSGCTVTHPQHLLELFWALQFKPETLDRHGLAPLDEPTKRAILGGNYARMIGLDAPAMQARHAGDAFDRVRKDGLRTPWSVWAELAP
jgi:uncharacterized protein